jgi:hypothetical protein
MAQPHITPADVQAAIRRSAIKYGVDPEAELSIADVEGGPRGRQSVGDHGTSYGPFQLHEGGALPRGRNAAWAGSNAGIDYATRSMAQSGARGLHGRAAIAAISRGFERPADPAGEIQRALAYYGGSAGVRTAAPKPPIAFQHNHPQTSGLDAAKGALLGYVLGNLQNYASTGVASSPEGIASLLSQSAQSPTTQPVISPTNIRGRRSVEGANSGHLGGPTGFATIPTRYATRGGIQLDPSVLNQAESITSRFGVRINSGYRSPAHNRSVGGAPHSDHLTGDAVDYTGSPAAIAALYKWAQGRYPYVEPMSQAHDHVHISFRRR